MTDFPSFFGYIIFLQFALLFFWFAMSIVVIVAIWRTMRAHESIAHSLSTMTQETKAHRTHGVSGNSQTSDSTANQ